MSREPWKRAYQLGRMVPHDARTPVEAKPLLRKRSGAVGWIIAGVVVLALAAAGWFFRDEILNYYKTHALFTSQAPSRSTATAKPTGSKPPTATQAAGAPQPATPAAKPGVDVEQIDAGLGINLIVLGDYLDLVKATRALSVQWDLKATGGGQLRMTAPGLTVYTENGQIRAYNLDLAAVYTAPAWKAWLPQLSKAGLTPGLAYAKASGSGDGSPPTASPESFTLRSTRREKIDAGWVTPSYELRFSGGGLSMVRAGLDFSRAGVPVGPAAPQQDNSGALSGISEDLGK